MKTLNLAAIVTSAVLLVLGASAQACDNAAKDIPAQRFGGKLPYQQSAPDSASRQDKQWEGATLVQEAGIDEDSAASRHQVLRMNMLSKRPY